MVPTTNVLGVDLVVKVFQLVELHIPRTTGTNHLRAFGNQRPVRQSAARHILADIYNLSAVV